MQCLFGDFDEKSSHFSQALEQILCSLLYFSVQNVVLWSSVFDWRDGLQLSQQSMLLTDFNLQKKNAGAVASPAFFVVCRNPHVKRVVQKKPNGDDADKNFLCFRIKVRAL